MSQCVPPTAIGIGPWKLGMLAACLFLWDVMWGSFTPAFKEAWKIEVIAIVAPRMHICIIRQHTIHIHYCLFAAASADQYACLGKIARLLMSIYPEITERRIVGHSEIAPDRKTDPGSAFDWSYFKSLLVD